MLPVTQATLVSKMYDHRATDELSKDLRTYVRLEYGGDGAEVRRAILAARTKDQAASRLASGRGILSALFEALSAAFPRPGGA